MTNARNEKNETKNKKTEIQTKAQKRKKKSHLCPCSKVQDGLPITKALIGIARLRRITKIMTLCATFGN